MFFKSASIGFFFIEANKAHYNIRKNIREVIAKNGGTMPEDLPTLEKSLKQLNIQKLLRNPWKCSKIKQEVENGKSIRRNKIFNEKIQNKSK